MIKIDTREHLTERQRIAAQFDALNVPYFIGKVDEGDYTSDKAEGIAIDRKKHLTELAYNCGQDHERFCRELLRAKNKGIHLIILCEHGTNFKTLDDVKKWKNPRLSKSPLAISGERLHKILRSISKKYDCEFRFCTKKTFGETAARILGEIPEKEKR